MHNLGVSTQNDLILAVIERDGVTTLVFWTWPDSFGKIVKNGLGVKVGAWRINVATKIFSCHGDVHSGILGFNSCHDKYIFFSSRSMRERRKKKRK